MLIYLIYEENHIRDQEQIAFVTLLSPLRYRPETYDMTGGDEFTPFDTPSTPFYETPALSDYSSRINRRIDFDEQEEIQALNRQTKREQTVQEVSQQLDQAQPI